MSKILLVLFLVTIPGMVTAQQQYADSLKVVIASPGSDSIHSDALTNLSHYYSLLYPDSALYYSDKLIELSIKSKYAPAEALGFLCKGEALDRFASYPEALKAALQALEIGKKLHSNQSFILGMCYQLIGHLNSITGNESEAKSSYLLARSFLIQTEQGRPRYYYTYFQFAYSYWVSDKMDSANYYLSKGIAYLDVIKQLHDASPWLVAGNIFLNSGEIEKAEHYFKDGMRISEEFNEGFLKAIYNLSFASISWQKKQKDSSLYYAHRALELSLRYKYKLFAANAYGFLADLYDGNNADSTVKYLKKIMIANENINGYSKGQQFRQVALDADKREKDLTDQQEQYQNKIRTYLLTTLAVSFLIIAFIFWRNNRNRFRANRLLTEQKNKLESTLTALKSTQALLIQSEKMASLGELTAGIAHEIQNPLNFVNNFSDVNKELIDELQTEKKRPLDERDEGLEGELLNDIAQNLDKINFHGKRAESIIKGMLLHSRTGSGQKELVDINALADEFLQLTFHGMRAKDKSFNISMKTDYDKGLAKVEVIPQDIGRVLLNLYNNAFYAVNEKKKVVGAGFEPMITIKTEHRAGNAVITVTDNGEGIPQKIIDKIFQPFFTTKATGQGTGLGLSLSYDIIKAHGGELQVKSKEGEFTRFTISLPAA